MPHTWREYVSLHSICGLPNMNHLLTSVVTGSGHPPDYPGQPGHILPGSTGFDPLHKISRSDLDFA